MKATNGITKALGLAALCALATPASATLFDFNPTSMGVSTSATDTTAGPTTVTVDGLGVTVSAVIVDNDNAGTVLGTTTLAGGSNPVGGPYNPGIYVSSGNNIGVWQGTSPADSHSMDGGSCDIACSSSTDPDEGLLFVFPHAVRLHYINFDSFSTRGTDDFNLTVDGTTLLVDYNSMAAANPLVTNVTGQIDEYYFNGLVGTEFLFWADGDSDSFRIDRFIVPEPATALLLAGGLLFGIRRRRLS